MKDLDAHHERKPTDKKVVIHTQVLGGDSVFFLCVAAILIALITNGYTCSDCSCRPPTLITDTQGET